MRNARIHSFGFGDSDDDADLKAEPPAGRLRARVGQRSTALRRLGAPTRLPDRIDLDPRLSRTGEPVSPAVLLGRTDVPLWHPGPRGRLVVVSPHPDDETLGAGGIIHDLCAGGWTVTVVAVTDGEAAYGRDDASAVERLAAIRRQEQSRAIAHLGKVDVLRVGVPDGEVANAAARLHSFLLGAADG